MAMHRYDDCLVRQQGDEVHEDDLDARDVTCNLCRAQLGLDYLPEAGDPRDILARQGAGSAAYLNPEGTDFESIEDYLRRIERGE